MGYREKNWRARLTLAALISLAAVGACLFYKLGDLDRNARESQREILNQAIRRAAVQCYALEGSYPPDLDYLIRHYGVSVDTTRFLVHYRAEGGNLTPDIEVLAIADEG